MKNDNSKCMALITETVKEGFHITSPHHHDWNCPVHSETRFPFGDI